LPIRLNFNYLYYAGRTISLTAAIFFLLAWAYFGYDSTDAGLIDPKYYGVGMHFSTYATVAASFYILCLNNQLNGLTIKSFKRNLKHDLKVIIFFTDMHKDRENYAFSREVEPIRGFFYALLISASLIFVFEVPYVFLVNYLHFDSLLYPIYIYDSGVLTNVFYRNFMLLIIPIWLSWFILYYPNKWRIKYNLDSRALNLLIITIAAWGLWIVYNPPEPIETVQSLGLDPNKSWVMPKQLYMPQTVNIYAEEGQHSNTSTIYHWHAENFIVHTLNIGVKTLTFLSIGYIFMARVERKNSR
jgi:hypothetical protein